MLFVMVVLLMDLQVRHMRFLQWLDRLGTAATGRHR